MSSRGPYTIAVLMGGVSREREVSLKTGQAVVNGLTAGGHRVFPIDITRIDGAQIPKTGIDLAFIALHGAFGEDGQVQTLLEQAGIPYTGSGPSASSLAMDKWLAKAVFARHGVPTPRARLYEAPFEVGRIAHDIGTSIHYPVVMKPAAEGSSIGVEMVDGPAGIEEAVGQVRGLGGSLLVEHRVIGREFTVSILEERALPIVELVVAGDFFDYSAKYQDDRTRYIVGPELEDATRRAIEEVALAAHRALGCCDYSRVDVMLCPQNGPQVLEVNTLPGFTAKSLFPKAAAASGLPFPELCDRLATLAIDRKRRLDAAA